MIDGRLELLLAHADDDHSPTLAEGLSRDSAAEEARPKPEDLIGPYPDPSGDPNDLELQRWGVIAPEGRAGDALLSLVAPLIRKREEDQGAPVTIYRVPEGMSASDAIAWNKNVYQDPKVAYGDWPLYLTVLGDVDRVSLALQQVMATEALVGRIVCASDAGYAAYVEKLLRWEGAPSPEAAARALFFTAKDGTAATTVGYDALVAPSVERCQETRNKGSFKAKDIVEIGYDGPEEAKNAFLEQIGRPEPSMLFTMSHGLGAPRGGWKSVDAQRETQGAMSFGSGVRLAAEDIGDKPFLPGGVWFFLACYGGGTPGESAYHHWLKSLKDAGGFGGRIDGVLAGLPKAGDRPFIARLPQAVLANPNGPLSVIAHMDLAWTYSFQDLGPDGQDRPSRFESLFSSLVKGARSGVSYRTLIHYLGSANYELTTMYNEEARHEAAGTPIEPDSARLKRRANLWMLREDLAGYVLLGDPAARLPLARGAAARKAEPRAAEARMVKAAPARAAEPAPRDVARMALAVHEKIAAKEGDEEIAARYGITREELRRWHDAYCAAGREALGKLS